ncbi:MAG: hypothetical protein PVI90_05050 [Desulfobacteraceae bacterium]
MPKCQEGIEQAPEGQGPKRVKALDDAARIMIHLKASNKAVLVEIEVVKAEAQVKAEVKVEVKAAAEEAAEDEIKITV